MPIRLKPSLALDNAASSLTPNKITQRRLVVGVASESKSPKIRLDT